MWGDKDRRAFDFMRARKGQYQRIPVEVLMDLARFCRANETCFNADARKHAVLEGRREVWLRIQMHLGLTTEQLMSLYAGQGYETTPSEETENG